MLQQYFLYDTDGWYTEPHIDVSDLPDVPGRTALVVPNGLYCPRLIDGAWVEGAPMPAYDPDTQECHLDYDTRQWTVTDKPIPSPDYYTDSEALAILFGGG